MSQLKIYENILVSGVDHDFSQNRHDNIPRQLLGDWLILVANLAKSLNPEFSIPKLPPYFSFTTEEITSDGPYPASADYYVLDFVYYKLVGEKDGIMISYEVGRREEEDPVSVQTLRLESGSSGFYPNYCVSSAIPKSARSPRATFYVSHDEAQTAEITNILARHQELCLTTLTNRNGIASGQEFEHAMNRDTLLVGWNGTSENERRAMTSVLQAIADGRGENIKWSSGDTLGKMPIVEIFAAARNGDALDVHFIYDFRIGRWAQSGSDWDEHHIHVGHACFRGGILASYSIVPDVVTILEYDCDSYDELTAVNARRAKAIAGLVNEQ